MFKSEKRGQVSIFVIVALVIVAGIAGYFVISAQMDSESTSEEFSEVYSYYSSCIEQYAKTGISIASVQGGRIDSGDYNPGSDYAPFGNQLTVSGFGVPYWFTVQGNGVLQENVPTVQNVEDELSEYIQSRLPECNFDIYRLQGLDVNLEVENVNVEMIDEGFLVDVESILSVNNELSSSTKSEFNVAVQSDFSLMFNEAKRVYQVQQENLFLENYSYDVLRLYAPVDGVEIQCAPKTWIARDVLRDLKSGLQANLQSLRFNSETDYFNVDVPLESQAQVIYDPSWPSRFEIYGNKGELLQAEPIGNQQGLQAMGFCYVPYHFVYDMFFPVLLRFTSENNEVFQFPMVVIIDKNVPREAYSYALEYETDVQQDLCEFATNDLQVNIRSSSGGAVEKAKVSYNCFDQICEVGNTNSQGIVQGKVPACLNGYLEVEAEGYNKKSQLFSSNNASYSEVFIDKSHNVKLNLLVDGKVSLGQAFVSFVGDYGANQAVIPESPNLTLTSGFYNVTVYQYGNASIRIPASTSRQCTEVSAGLLGGLFGRTKEQCFDITIPETIIDRALTAGGQGEIYLTEELLESGEINLIVNALPRPTGIESLQTNYALFETQGVDVIYD